MPVLDDSGLKPSMKAVADNYLFNPETQFNGTQSYAVVHPTATLDTCRNEASTTLAKPDVAAYLKERSIELGLPAKVIRKVDQFLDSADDRTADRGITHSLKIHGVGDGANTSTHQHLHLHTSAVAGMSTAEKLARLRQIGRA